MIANIQDKITDLYCEAQATSGGSIEEMEIMKEIKELETILVTVRAERRERAARRA